MSTIKQVALLTLIAWCSCLQNETNLNQIPPLISILYFMQGDILYINKNNEGFGHIDTSSGNLKYKFTLETN